MAPGEFTLPQNRKAIAGSAAGLTSVSVTFPLDLVRTRLSAQTPQTMRYGGIVHAFVRIAREEGISGFYKGITPSLIVRASLARCRLHADARVLTLSRACTERCAVFRSQFHCVRKSS
jgi:hypothetical protein